MKRLSRFLLALLFLVICTIFFSFLSIWTYFSNPENIIKSVENSGFYEELQPAVQDYIEAERAALFTTSQNPTSKEVAYLKFVDSIETSIVENFLNSGDDSFIKDFIEGNIKFFYEQAEENNAIDKVYVSSDLLSQTLDSVLTDANIAIADFKNSVEVCPSGTVSENAESPDVLDFSIDCLTPSEVSFIESYSQDFINSDEIISQLTQDIVNNEIALSEIDKIYLEEICPEEECANVSEIREGFMPFTIFWIFAIVLMLFVYVALKSSKTGSKISSTAKLLLVTSGVNLGIYIAIYVLLNLSTPSILEEFRSVDTEFMDQFFIKLPINLLGEYLKYAITILTGIFVVSLIILVFSKGKKQIELVTAPRTTSPISKL